MPRKTTNETKSMVSIKTIDNAIGFHYHDPCCMAPGFAEKMEFLLKFN